MTSFDYKNFSDRIKNSAASRAAAIKRHAARPGPDDPRVAAKAAERKSIHEARVAREAERMRAQEAQRVLELERRRAQEEDEIASALARDAAIEAEELATQAAKRERAKNMMSNLADQKESRDARYAARKARQKQAKRG